MKIQDDPPIQVDTQDILKIALGKIPGKSVIHKFGKAFDFDSGDGFVDLWSGANDASHDLMQYTYSTTADIDSLSSTQAADTQKIEVQGLDKNYKLIVQTITLTGQTRVALDTALIRVFRLKNVGSTDLTGIVYCFVNVATTNGVPDTLVNIRALLDIGYNQTMMCLYTIPAYTTGLLYNYKVKLLGAKQTADYVPRLYVRPFGQVFQVKDEGAIDDAVTSKYEQEYVVPERIAAKSDIAVRVDLLTAAKTAASATGTFELVLVEDD